jgi:outer membrane biosynthesis protein TonB
VRQTLITVLTLMIVWTFAVAAQAQAAKGAEQKPTTAATAKDTDQPNEVELAIAETIKRGDMVVGICIEKCKDYEKVIDGLNKGHALSLPKPSYSPLARAAHVSGTVTVQVLIDLDGKVIAAAATSGHPLLLGTSLKAARESEFTPTKLNGQPVKVTGIIQYNFVAQ